jgi:murein DD-endopeptidase MepM/ murein hydrolase activator NlpD
VRGLRICQNVGVAIANDLAVNDLVQRGMMNFCRPCLKQLGIGLAGGCFCIAPFRLDAVAQPPLPQSPQSPALAVNPCPQQPALERFQSYQVKAGDTLAKIAQRSGLLGTTLMGANPSIRSGRVIPGQTLKIPPYNGIVVSVPTGQTLKSVAAIYRVKPDLLFEVNGCQTAPRVVFVPGINWSPNGASTGATAAVTPLPTQPIGKVAANLRQDHYPLNKPADVRRSYGWQGKEKIVFSSGVDLAATPGTYALAVADGTVAFAGPRKPWGRMVVVNHVQGRQTRYGYLDKIKVKTGQIVQRGQILGAIAPTPAALRFEMRYRSNLGWVAQDPLPYLQAISPARSSSQH